MILFLKNWQDYEEAIPDYKTNNKTFLRFSGLLKAMGVKNHLFPLALHNAELQGIDPHDEERLTDEIKFKIVEEVIVNPWYYFREVSRAPGRSGSEPIKLRANRGNIGLFWSFYNHLTVLLIQPRQTGKSFNTDQLMTGLMQWHTKKSDILLLTKDSDLRDRNIDRLKAIQKVIPSYLRTNSKKDTDNKESMYNAVMENTYGTAVGQNSPSNASNAGRGFTVPIMHVDEIAHIKFIEEMLQAASPATTEARDIAKSAGAPYGNIYTTTAAKLDTASGKYIYKTFYQAGAAWSERFYDAENVEALHLLVRNASTNDNIVVVLDFNHRQLGFTDDWLRERIKLSNSNRINAEIDFLNKWSRGSSASPLSPEALKKIAASELKDYYTEITEYGYIVRWYIPQDEIKEWKDKSLVLSLDTSDAIGNDEIGLVVLDPYTGRVLAVADINKTNLNKFNAWIFSWITNFSKLVVMPERKSSAITLIDYLIEMCVAYEIDPFKRIFNWVVNDKNENKERYKTINIPMRKRHEDVYVDYKKFFGFGTSGSGRTSRDILYSQGLARAARFIGSTVNDSRLISQIGALTIKNGRIDHSAGLHDDLVVSWLLGYYLISMGNNLEFYGIDSAKILSESLAENRDQSDAVEDNRKDKEQQLILNKINERLELIKGYTISSLERISKIREVRMLYNNLDNVAMRSFNLESRLKEITEMQKLKSIAKNKLYTAA